MKVASVFIKDRHIKGKLLKVCVVLIIFSWLRKNRKLRGWFQTFTSVVTHALNPWAQEYDSHTFTHQDGERSVILTPKGQDALEEGDHVWVFLPGGMSSGDNFYTEECYKSGLTHGSKVCIFHQPGILNVMASRVTPCLAETIYTKDYLTHLRNKRMDVSLIGWSAGSILAIKIASELDPTLLVGTVAIHGPSIIDDVFDIHRNSYFRLDIPFALWLYFVLWKSKSLSHVPVSVQFPMLRGWDWMKDWTKTVYKHSSNVLASPSTKVSADQLRNSWGSITQSWLSWEDMKTFPSNLVRVVALNDPVVIYDEKIAEKIERQKDFFEHWLYEDGGHCVPFWWCKGFTARLVRWHEDKFQRYKAIQASPSFQFPRPSEDPPQFSI